MDAFNGKLFRNSVEALDPHSRELFERHGTSSNGRWSFVEQIVEEAMVQMSKSRTTKNEAA